MQVAISPLLIGAGPASLTLRDPVARLADAIRPETRSYGLGPEVVFDCALSPEAVAAWAPIHAAPVVAAGGI